MFKGGYKIIDLKDTPFTAGGAAMMIDGIYDAIEASYRKPLMLAGLNVGGVECGAAFVVPTLVESAYTFTVYGYVITVQDTDAVTVELADDPEADDPEADDPAADDPEAVDPEADDPEAEV